MDFLENINQIERYILNDEDRKKYIRLDKNELSFQFPEQILNDVKESIDSYLLQAYPSTIHVNTYLSNLLEHSDESQILAVPGADYGLKLCFDGLVVEGDVVAFPEYTYAMNEVFSNIANASVKTISIENNLDLNINDVLDVIEQSKMIVLANPNQPTAKIEDMTVMENIISKAHDNDCWVIIDEAYYPFSEYTLSGYVNKFDNLIVIRTLSKLYGLAGVRIGAVISQTKNIQYLLKALPVYPVNSFAIACLKTCVKHKQYFLGLVSELKSQRKRLTEYYYSIGCMPFDSSTNFIMVESKDVFDVKKYSNYLKEKNILIRDGWRKKIFVDAFRITVSNEENISRLIELTNYYINKNE